MEAGSPVAKLQLELPSSLAHEMQSTGRCSFDAQDRFFAFEHALASEITSRRRSLSGLRNGSRAGAVAARLALATEAARQNSPTTHTPYRAPSDHEFREPTSPVNWAPQANGRDFQTKFALPSNQDIRRRTARDQEGFFGAAPGEDVLPLPLSPPSQQQLHHLEAIKAQSARSPPKSSPAKPAFSSRVTHTSRKSANEALRLEIVLDQEGLLPQLQEIRQHRYRDGTKSPVPFLAKFRPASPLQPMSPN